MSSDQPPGIELEDKELSDHRWAFVVSAISIVMFCRIVKVAGRALVVEGPGRQEPHDLEGCLYRHDLLDAPELF